MSFEAQNPLGGTMLVVECDVESSAKQNWTCCQLMEFCAKVDEIDEKARRGELEPLEEGAYDDLRADGNEAAALFRDGWNTAASNGTIANFDQQAVRGMFYADCAYDQAQANNFQIGPEMQPDHIHEIQAGGGASNLSNLRWLSTTVNRSIGSTNRSVKPGRHTAVSADCCPAESGYCQGKSPSQGVLP
jgi:hypothetical protein